MASSSCLILPPSSSSSSSHDTPLPPPSTISTLSLLPHFHQEEELLFYLHLQQQQQHLLDVHRQQKFDRMVRKRPASELDLQPDSSSYPNPARLARRTNLPSSSSSSASASSAAMPAAFIGDLQGHSPLMFDPSTAPNPPPILLSGAGPNPALATLLQSLPPQLPAPPAVCGFSGLPLFSSEMERGGGGSANVDMLQGMSSSALGGVSDEGTIGGTVATTA